MVNNVNKNVKNNFIKLILGCVISSLMKLKSCKIVISINVSTLTKSSLKQLKKRNAC